MWNKWLILILLVIFFIIRNKKEHFSKQDDNKQGDYIEPISSDISDIFEDAVKYDYVEGEVSGIEKCYNECKGTCLEYGLSGSGWCFGE
jgi:hypothetical protein